MKNLRIPTLAAVFIHLVPICANAESEPPEEVPAKSSQEAESAGQGDDRLQKSIRELLTQLDGIAKEAGNDEAAMTKKRTAAAFRNALGSGSFEGDAQLQTLTQSLNSILTYFPELGAEVAEAQQLLQKVTEARDQDRIDELEAVFQELAGTLLAAEEPEELDSWIQRLTNLSGGSAGRFSNSQGSKEELQRLNNYLRSASQVAVYWQDYLMNKKLKNVEACQRSVSNLTSQIVQFPYVPRSKILVMQARLNSPNPFGDEVAEDVPTIDNFVERITSVQSVLDLKSELAQMGSNRRNELKINRLYSNLEKFENGYNQIARGSYSSGFNYLRELQGMKRLGYFATELMLSGFRKALSIPDEFESKDGEDTDAFLDRYLRSTANDPTKLQRAIKTSVSLLSPGSKRTALNDEQKAVDLLVIAKAYEKQEQFARAIVAYRLFLSMTTQYAVTDEATKSLAKLKKEHPGAAESAQSMSSHTSSIPRVYPPRLTREYRDLIRKEVMETLERSGHAKEMAEDEDE